jgi:nucleotide-binding universal stress UspA family protein
MSDIKSIMVAMGFSKYCPTLFEYAAGLAMELDADLVVGSVIDVHDVEAVSSIESMGYKVDTDQYIKGVKDDRISTLNNLLKKSPFPKEKLKTIFKVGHPFDQLMEIIEKEKVDMVVIGTKGHSDLSRVLIGSVAEKIIRHAPVTVVSFRTEATC